jgi:hypothetical protein
MKGLPRKCFDIDLTGRRAWGPQAVVKTIGSQQCVPLLLYILLGKLGKILYTLHLFQ